MSTEAATARGLSAQQVGFFHREGYLVLPELFDDADLQPAIDDIGRAIDQQVAELLRRGELSRSYAEYDFQHRLATQARLVAANPSGAAPSRPAVASASQARLGSSDASAPARSCSAMNVPTSRCRARPHS